jgi:hypothetical protein
VRQQREDADLLDVHGLAAEIRVRDDSHITRLHSDVYKIDTTDTILKPAAPRARKLQANAGVAQVPSVSEEEATRLRGGGAVDDGSDKRGRSTSIVRDERVATKVMQQLPVVRHRRLATDADVRPAEPAVLRRERQCNDAKLKSSSD